MKFFRKTIPYLATLALFGAFLLASARPSMLGMSFFAIVVVAAAASGTLAIFAFRKRQPIAPEILPALLAASSFFAMVFVEETVLRIATSLVAAFLFFVLVKQLPAAAAENYYTDLLRAISEWSVLLVVFFTGAGLLAAAVFLNFNQYAAFLIFAGVSVLLAFVLYTLSPAPTLASAIAFAVVVSEGFLVLYFFPFSYWVSAGILATVTYTLIGITRGASGRELKRSAYTAVLAAAALLGTSRWS